MRIMKCLAIFLLYFGVNLCENGIEFTHETQLYKPFFEVVVSGDEKAVQDLINNGADVNKADETLSAPIHFAANAGFDRIVGLLIQNNANINTVNKDGYSPLHFASVKGHEKVAALLIQSGADVDIANKFGETPLHHAANNGYGGIVNLLLQNSANVNATNKLGDTALHFASNKGHEDIVNKLIENGINVNVANNNSDTALHLASVNSNGKTNIVKVLLQNNANQSIRNKNGKLPIDLASKAGYSSIVEALQGFSLTEKACEVYSKRITDRILRGEIADTTDFPWTVALGYINDEYHINFECTGTIISEYFILTAANCISTTHRPVVVRVGKSAVIDGRTNRRKNYNIVDIIRHPNYSLETKKHDIALVKVSRPIEFTDTVRPACLQTDLKDKNPDVNLFVSGWQVDSKQDTNSTDGFFYTNVTTVSLSDCNRTFSDMNKSQDVSYLQNGVDESQYCAHDPVGLKHTCESHYGAPLQIISNVVNKVKVVGIISFGSICGTTLPAVYTRVAYYLNWIEAIVWPNGIASE